MPSSPPPPPRSSKPPKKKKMVLKKTIVDHTYRDYSRAALSDLIEDEREVNEELFPHKLHAILSTPVYARIITWMPHGRAWYVVDRAAFVSIVLPTHFNHGNFESFNRSVNGWGFKRLVREGPDRNAYYHELFLRGRPELAGAMARLSTPGRDCQTKLANPTSTKLVESILYLLYLVLFLQSLSHQMLKSFMSVLLLRPSLLLLQPSVTDTLVHTMDISCTLPCLSQLPPQPPLSEPPPYSQRSRYQGPPPYPQPRSYSQHSPYSQPQPYSQPRSYTQPPPYPNPPQSPQSLHAQPPHPQPPPYQEHRPPYYSQPPAHTQHDPEHSQWLPYPSQPPPSFFPPPHRSGYQYHQPGHAHAATRPQPQNFPLHQPNPWEPLSVPPGRSDWYPPPPQHDYYSRPLAGHAPHHDYYPPTAEGHAAVAWHREEHGPERTYTSRILHSNQGEEVDERKPPPRDIRKPVLKPDQDQASGADSPSQFLGDLFDGDGAASSEVNDEGGLDAAASEQNPLDVDNFYDSIEAALCSAPTRDKEGGEGDGLPK